MFDHGFGPDIRKFLSPLKNRVSKTDAKEFQTILVTATMTKVETNIYIYILNIHFDCRDFKI